MQTFYKHWKFIAFPCSIINIKVKWKPTIEYPLNAKQSIYIYGPGGGGAYL